MKTTDELIQALEQGALEFEIEFNSVIRRMLDRERGDTERYCRLRDDLAARGILPEPLAPCIDFDDEEKT